MDPPINLACVDNSVDVPRQVQIWPGGENKGRMIRSVKEERQEVMVLRTFPKLSRTCLLPQPLMFFPDSDQQQVKKAQRRLSRKAPSC